MCVCLLCAGHLSTIVDNTEVRDSWSCGKRGGHIVKENDDLRYSVSEKSKRTLEE